MYSMPYVHYGSVEQWKARAFQHGVTELRPWLIQNGIVGWDRDPHSRKALAHVPICLVSRVNCKAA